MPPLFIFGLQLESGVAHVILLPKLSQRTPQNCCRSLPYMLGAWDHYFKWYDYLYPIDKRNGDLIR